MYESSSVLKTHLYQIINSPFKKYFVYNDIISKDEYIRRMFLTKSNEEAQIINISLDSLDDRLAKILTKLYSKLFFEYVTSLSNRGSFPINIILEEAHRYVNDDKDRIVIGYNIFDRITKEGRKYGLLMGFITQRPSELSQTSLSQCSNFLVFRLFHPEDYNMIDRITNGLTNDSLDRLKNLRNGVALAFGNAFSVPFLVSIDLPDPLPLSNNVKISNTWYN
jgi:DNA helicase HerA-like ATPase